MVVVGDRVVVVVAGLRENGTARYVGPLLHDTSKSTSASSSSTWIGIELDLPRGKHNGTVQGTAYFKTAKPNCGVLASEKNVTVVPSTNRTPTSTVSRTQSGQIGRNRATTTTTSSAPALTSRGTHTPRGSISTTRPIPQPLHPQRVRATTTVARTPVTSRATGATAKTPTTATTATTPQLGRKASASSLTQALRRQGSGGLSHNMNKKDAADEPPKETATPTPIFRPKIPIPQPAPPTNGKTESTLKTEVGNLVNGGDATVQCVKHATTAHWDPVPVDDPKPAEDEKDETTTAKVEQKEPSHVTLVINDDEETAVTATSGSHHNDDDVVGRTSSTSSLNRMSSKPNLTIETHPTSIEPPMITVSTTLSDSEHMPKIDYPNSPQPDQPIETNYNSNPSLNSSGALQAAKLTRLSGGKVNNVKSLSNDDMKHLNVTYGSDIPTLESPVGSAADHNSPVRRRPSFDPKNVDYQAFSMGGTAFGLVLPKEQEPPKPKLAPGEKESSPSTYTDDTWEVCKLGRWVVDPKNDEVEDLFLEDPSCTAASIDDATHHFSYDFTKFRMTMNYLEGPMKNMKRVYPIRRWDIKNAFFVTEQTKAALPLVQDRTVDSSPLVHAVPSPSPPPKTNPNEVGKETEEDDLSATLNKFTFGASTSSASPANNNHLKESASERRFSMTDEDDELLLNGRTIMELVEVRQPEDPDANIEIHARLSDRTFIWIRPSASFLCEHADIIDNLPERV
eukprot:PhM_4_TR18802/c0_g1_i1/m.91560